MFICLFFVCNLSVKGFTLLSKNKYACIRPSFLHVFFSYLTVIVLKPYFRKIDQVPCCMWLTLDISKPFCTSKLRRSWSNEGTCGLCFLFKLFSLGTVSMWCLKCGVVTLCGLWTVNNIYLKVALLQNGCFIQALIHYLFVLRVLYQKQFLLLLLACCFSHLKKICLWHNLPQIHSKLYICFPIKNYNLLN